MTSSLRSVSSPALDALRRDEPGRRLGVIVPVGAVEQHGPLLPVTCDVDLAEGAAAALAAGLSANPRYRALTAPAVPYGPVPGADRTAGTSSVSYDDIGRYLSAVVRGFARTDTWSFVVIMNAHGHNHGRVIEASAQLYAERRVPILAVQLYDFAHVVSEFGLKAGLHGGEFEMAAHAHYAGTTLDGPALNGTPAPRPRPSTIYGLDLLPRSYEGVIAPELPSRARALAAADRLGPRLDAMVLARVVDDLDTYFRHWAGADPA